MIIAYALDLFYSFILCIHALISKTTECPGTEVRFPTGKAQFIPVARTFPFPQYVFVNHSCITFVMKVVESILRCCHLDLIAIANV